MNAEGTTRGRRPPTHYSVADRERLRKEQAESGLTKKAFCAERGINIGTFHGWTKRANLKKRKQSFAEVAVTAPTPGEIEIDLPGGSRVRVPVTGNVEQTAALVRGITRC